MFVTLIDSCGRHDACNTDRMALLSYQRFVILVLTSAACKNKIFNEDVLLSYDRDHSTLYVVYDR